MKAIVLHEYGPPSNLKFEDREDPRSGPGEVLVEVGAAGLNPIDWKLRSGSYKDRIPLNLPAVLGFDLAGTVREIGPGVTGFQVGDQVLAFSKATYAQLCTVKASDLARLPEGLEILQAAALATVSLTGAQLIRVAAKVQAGQTVLIAGALGSVGRMAVFAAREAGARIIAGVRTQRLEQARQELNVEEVIALDDDAALAKLDKVDAIANTLLGDTLDKLTPILKEGGVFGSVAGTPTNSADFPTVQVNRIQAVSDSATLEHVADVVQRGELDLPIERIFPLGDAAQAHALAENGGPAGKIVLGVSL